MPLAQINALDREIKHLRDENEQLREKRLRDIASCLNHLHKEIREMRKEIKGKDAEIEKLKEEIHQNKQLDVRHKLTEIEKMNDELNKQCDELDRDNDELEKAFDSLINPRNPGNPQVKRLYSMCPRLLSKRLMLAHKTHDDAIRKNMVDQWRINLGAKKDDMRFKYLVDQGKIQPEDPEDGPVFKQLPFGKLGDHPKRDLKRKLFDEDDCTLRAYAQLRRW